MYEDTLSIVVGAAIFVAILCWATFEHWRRQLRARRLLIHDLLKQYFQGEVPTDRLGKRTREIAGRYLMRDATFYPLVIAAFQHTADEKLADQAHSNADERRLFGLLAALKKEFGLPDRYQIEGWRAGRE
jgi:hypothetical protein